MSLVNLTAVNKVLPVYLRYLKLWTLSGIWGWLLWMSAGYLTWTYLPIDNGWVGLMLRGWITFCAMIGAFNIWLVGAATLAVKCLRNEPTTAADIFPKSATACLKGLLLGVAIPTAYLFFYIPGLLLSSRIADWPMTDLYDLPEAHEPDLVKQLARGGMLHALDGLGLVGAFALTIGFWVTGPLYALSRVALFAPSLTVQNPAGKVE